jgi:hypothetical protein
VFGNWISRIGLDLTPAAHGAGPLNMIGRELGVRPPFRQTVKEVCVDWLGCFDGVRGWSVWVTPLAVTVEGLPEPGRPQAYAMTAVPGS